MIIIITFKQLLEIRILIELAVGCCQLLFHSKMAAIEVQHLILFLLIVLVYCSLYGENFYKDHESFYIIKYYFQ